MSSNNDFVACTSNKHSAESEALGGRGVKAKLGGFSCEMCCSIILTQILVY